MIVSSVFSSLVSLFLVLFLGSFLRSRKIIDEQITKGLSSLLVLVCTPAMVLYTLQQEYSTQRLWDLGRMSLGVVVMVVAGLLPCLLVCRLRRVPLSEQGVWLNCVGFSNAVFMVRPMALALYGDAVNFPISAVLFAFNLLFYSVGVLLVNMGKPRQGSMVKLIFRSLLNPTMVCSTLGVLLFIFSIRLPQPVVNSLEMLTNFTSPLAMLIIGSLLAGASLKSLLGDRRVYILSGLRLLVAPLLTYLIARTFIHDVMLLNLITLSACMPTATSAAVFAERYDNQPLLASKTVFVSTMLSMATIPLYALLLR